MFEQSMKMVGFVVNVILLMAFALLAIKLTSNGFWYLASAGGVPDASSVIAAMKQPTTIVNALVGSVGAGTFVGTAIGYAGAWILFVGAAGAWWMTALGTRWLFLAVKRTVT